MRVGEAFEKAYEHDDRPVLADLARHFVAGAPLGTGDKAVHYSGRSAAQAMRAAGYDEAISHLRTALALAPPRSTDRLELLGELGVALLRSGHFGESFETHSHGLPRGP